MEKETIIKQLGNLKTQQKNTEILYNKIAGAIEALTALVEESEVVEPAPAKKSKK